VYAQGREARLTAAIVGESGLPPADRRALAFTERFEKEFIDQGDTRRTIGETLEIGWTLLETLPREDLHRIPEEAWARRAGRGPRHEGLGPPTRSNLIRHRRRLERVRKGIDLLTRKRQALVADLFRVATPAIEARTRVEESAARAYPALLGAAAAHGARASRRWDGRRGKWKWR